jgi:uncharacterized membrane protein
LREYYGVTLDLSVLAIIAGMAALTYLTRIGGVWIAGRVQRPERLENWFQPIPGAILSAIVAPAVLDAGWRGLIALAIVVLAMTRSGSILLAATLGTASIALLRL